MRRTEYLMNPDVQAFIAWLEDRFQDNSFGHYWTSPYEEWSCTSLFHAYKQYRWNGRDFLADRAYLRPIAERLRHAVRSHSVEDQRSATNEVLDWGGIRNIRPATLHGFHQRLHDSLAELQPDLADADQLGDVPMNSGFSKVYHLLIPELPMYDTRVGAGLGLLTRMFLQEEQRRSVPGELRWGYGAARVRTDRTVPLRDPSVDPLVFPSLRRKGTHARSKVMAAWVFGELAKLGCWTGVDEELRVRAVQSAFFMVGYDVTATPKAR